MSSPRKTVGTVLFAMTELTNAATLDVAVSAEIDVAKKDYGMVYLHHGFFEGGSNANPQKWLIQISGQTSGNADWMTYQEVNITFSGTVGDEGFDANEAAGVKEIAVGDTTGFAHADSVLVHHTELTFSEWATVAELVSNTTITLVDALTTDQTSATSTLFGSAQHNAIPMDLRGINRLRVLYYNNLGAAMDSVIEATMTTLDQYS